MKKPSPRPPTTKHQYVRAIVRMMFEKDSDGNLQYDLYLLVGQVLGFIHPNVDLTETQKVSVCRFRLIDDSE